MGSFSAVFLLVVNNLQSVICNPQSAINHNQQIITSISTHPPLWFLPLFFCFFVFFDPGGKVAREHTKLIKETF